MNEELVRDIKEAVAQAIAKDGFANNQTNDAVQAAIDVAASKYRTGPEVAEEVQADAPAGKTNPPQA